MARRKKIRDPHTELVGVRYTLEQKQRLEEQASPVPLSTFIRNLSLHRSRPQSVPLINWKTYQELQQISVNIRQINQALTNATRQAQLSDGEQLQHWYSLLQDIKLELKQIGTTVIAASQAEDGEDESRNDETEFTL